VKIYLLLVDPWKSSRPSPGEGPEGIGVLRGGEYVYVVARGMGTEGQKSFKNI